MYFNDLESDFTKNLMTTNMTSLTLMCKLVLPIMEKRQKGAIVNIASVLGLDPAPLFSLYSASKSYVINFSRSLAIEYKGKGITVQSLCPGGVDTGMIAFLPEKNKAKFFIPSPEEFAASAVRTIGFSDNTCGFWPHSINAYILEWIGPNKHFKMNLKVLEELKNKK